ncbi:TIGR00730 family Rossman fold protein [Bacillus salitolerans]|uniref:Cytokinin riboside 5'-monophosphate phosphoribohydrolase n=1 Tax=Bacillus salitolerans TaxID=1437434 RepID=A0ABW4LIK3_9BACI
MKLKRLCVFCGSSTGKHPEYINQAKQLGEFLAKRGIELIYGGGNIGIMGEVSRAVLENGGHSIGVIPKKIFERVEHVELTELFVVEDMHERKSKMYELADGFIALPGGIGTLEELAEVMTWYQIGYHNKPIALFNINQYYDSFVSLLQHMVDEGFLNGEYVNSLIVEDHPKALLDEMERHEAEFVDKWSKQ